MVFIAYAFMAGVIIVPMIVTVINYVIHGSNRK